MELGATAFRLRLETLGFDADGPLMVVASSNALDDLLYGSLALSVTSVVAPHEDRQLLLIQSDDDGVVEELCVLVRDGGADPVLGCARAAGGLGGLRAAMAQALSGHQLAVGRAPGERIVRDLGIASHTDLVSFLEPHIQQAFHDAVLASIERWDLAHDAALLSTLAAFLANDGQLRRTAALMHIHHNTLHYRLDKIAQLTGRDARTTQGRTDFVLALAIRRTQGPRRERLGERNTDADPSGPSTS
jgi:hypothetical protein